MDDKILNTIYNLSKNYKDPVSNLALDKNNKNLSITIKKGNVNLSLIINPNDERKYDELIENLKLKINEIDGVLSVNIILTAEKTQNNVTKKKAVKKIANNSIIILIR